MSDGPITPLQISQAMLDANGSIPLAAVHLKLTEKALEQRIDADEALRKRWREKPVAPPITTMISRPDDTGLAEALAREERLLAEGLKGLGISESQQTLAMSLQRFQRANYGQVVNLTAGGMVKCFLGTMEDIENIRQRLEALDVPPEQVLAYESVLREDRVKLLDIIYKFTAQVNTNVMIQAKIQKMFGDESKAGAKSKPGFAPLKRVVEKPQPPPEPPATE